MDKLTRLLAILEDMKSAVIAYSGGVDSTFLLNVLKLSGIEALAVTAKSELMPSNEIISAKKLANNIGIKHLIVETHELSDKNFVINNADRCFVCKDKRFKIFKDIAKTGRYRFAIDGSNLDDLDDFRPGSRAAKKHKVRSPLIEAGFSKKDIRIYSKKLGLSTWDKPSSSCLATRIPYGQKITSEAISRIEKAEAYLSSLGLTTVRLRDHAGLARIETDKKGFDLLLRPDKRKLIEKKLRSFGYAFVSADLSGYRTGSMNRLLKK